VAAPFYDTEKSTDGTSALEATDDWIRNSAKSYVADHLERTASFGMLAHSYGGSYVNGFVAQGRPVAAAAYLSTVVGAHGGTIPTMLVCGSNGVDLITSDDEAARAAYCALQATWKYFVHVVGGGHNLYTDAICGRVPPSLHAARRDSVAHLLAAFFRRFMFRDRRVPEDLGIKGLMNVGVHFVLCRENGTGEVCTEVGGTGKLPSGCK
jgi:hypothetical protein